MAEDASSTPTRNDDIADLRAILNNLAEMVALMTANMRGITNNPPNQNSIDPNNLANQNPNNPARTNPNPGTVNPNLEPNGTNHNIPSPVNPPRPPPTRPIIEDFGMYNSDDDDDDDDVEISKAPEVRKGKRPIVIEDDVMSRHEELNEKIDQKITKLNLMQKKIDEQYKNLNRFEKADWSSGLEIAEKVNIPPRMKLPKLEKYDGLDDPSMFLRLYFGTLVPLKLDEITLVQIFPRYLTGAALKWYHKKNIAMFETRKELADAFMSRFHMHICLEDPKKKLKNIKQGFNEGFRAFMTRWKAIASEVDDLPSDEEQIQLILDSLNNKYCTQLLPLEFYNLRSLMRAGNNLEDAFIRSEPLSSNNNVNKFQKKVKAEVNQVENTWSTEERSFSRQPNYRRQNSGYDNRVNEQRNDQAPRKVFSNDKPRRQYDDLGMSLSQAFELFLKKGLIQKQVPRTDVPFLGVRKNDFCDYHQMHGHGLDYCSSLRNKIQDMIDNKEITKPNVKKNPLPNHEVNVIETIDVNMVIDDPSSLIVDEMTDPVTFIIDIWDEVPEILKPKPSVNPWEDEKEAINVWEEKSEILDIWADVEVNATRRGTNYQPVFMKTVLPEVVPKSGVDPIRSVEKGKEKVDEPAPMPVNNLLNQLRKTNANISMWELLMSSVDHRQAVLNELSQIEISPHTTPEQLVNLVSNERKQKKIEFGDDDLPESGFSHARALYITVQANGKSVPLVLIDNGSALNICPWKIAERLGVKRVDILPSDLCVKGFDSAKKEIMGNTKIDVKVAGISFEVEFCVIDISPSYNLILGRPWLHQSKAVSSTLHQKLRFIHEGRVVTIEGDIYTVSGSATSHISQHDVELNGFDCNPIFEQHDDQIADFPKFNRSVLKMMAGMSYFPGMGLGKDEQGTVNPIKAFGNRCHRGLGYNETDSDDKGRPRGTSCYIPPTLNGQFVREGETTLCFDFREPFTHPITNKQTPGFEIFQTCPNKPANDLFSICHARNVSCWEETLAGLTRLFQECDIRSASKPEDSIHVSRRYQLGEGVTPLDLITTDDEDEKTSTDDDEADPFLLHSFVGQKSSLDSISISLEPKEAVSKKSFVIDFPILNNDTINRVNNHTINENEISEYSHDSEFPYFDNETPYEIKRQFEKENEQISSAEQTIEINLNTEDEPQIVLIGKSLNENEKRQMTELLKQNKEVFAWSYRDMPGIDPAIVQHHIPLYSDARPVKQKFRRMRADIVQKIKDEVIKQIDAGFLEVVDYPEWVANIVPVPKKDGKIRVCVDYRDLNKASPKDNFPLPHIDVLIDHAAGHELLSFMDGFSGYNQVLMAPEDKHKTTFITEMGTFCYKVMPFGLKNAGATYQRAATTLLHDMIHKEVEVYVDDMIVKSKKREGHLQNLEKFLARIKKYNLRLNPKKCAFGVTSGKMLGFMITQRGIEVDPGKIEAIASMPIPKCEKDVRSFLGRIQYVSRFISKLTMTCDPLFKLLKKNEKFVWDDNCQHAFDRIKEYLQSPPILMSPRPGVPLILYLTVTDTAMGSLLAQENNEKVEVAVYYVSKRMTGYELKYSSIEKVCWALAWVTKRLRHYMQAHQIKLVSRLDPLRYLFQRTLLSPRLSKWMMMISEYDIEYVTQKSIKGSAVADFLADNPIEVDDEEEMMFPDEEIMNVDEQVWTLRFDGASGQQGYGVGILLIDPNGTYNPVSIKLEYPVTNNEAEYEACLLGMKIAFEKGATKLEVIGDSNLVISQANGVWQVKGENLKPYHKYLTQLIAKFDQVTFTHAPRCQNRFADALATLAAMTQIPDGIKMKPLKIRQQQSRFFKERTVANTETEVKPWYDWLQKYLENGEYPAQFQKKERRALRQYANNYVILAGKLYRRSFDGQNMLCVTQNEANEIMFEVHEGVCGPHMNGQALAKKILRFGYYWQNLERDCIAFVKSCHKCQIYANLKHTPASSLYNMTSPWPFSTWGIDIIGKIYPHASNGHEFILVAIDYFTKWVEAASYKILKSSHVAKFIRNNIICRYGVPHSMISDNGKHFEGEVLKVLAEFKIEHHKSSPYRPQTNGAVEAANKNVITILKKMTQTYKDWHEKLPYALWGYRTTSRTSTGETPYALVYGMDAVQPIEIEFPTLRVMLESKVVEADWAKSRYDQLALMEDKRLDSLCNMQVYQKRMSTAFNKKVQPRNIKERDLVLRKVRNIMDPRGKFQPRWEGPFIVKKILSGGAVRLMNLDGEEMSAMHNVDSLKRYFA